MSAALLDVQNLSVGFSVKGGWGRAQKTLWAVDDVSFYIEEGETLGLVGESGSGKTTTALAVARLIEPGAGRVLLSGDNLLALPTNKLRRARARLQLIFQDPFSALNPRLRAEDVVREPLKSLQPEKRAEHQQIIDAMFTAVGLRPEHKRLFPHQFSGGQRQRIGIARALATRPELIICDEPVSALDVAVQAQILNLLRELQGQLGLTLLFISHDLGVVQFMCNRIAVMYMGKIVEVAQRKALFGAPAHPYTRALLDAVPRLTPAERQTRLALHTGSVPDLTNPPSGCRYASRCPLAEARCHTQAPALRPLSPQHEVACHLAG